MGVPQERGTEDRQSAMSGSPQPARCGAAGAACPEKMQPLGSVHERACQPAEGPSQNLASTRTEVCPGRTGKQDLSADATRSLYGTRGAIPSALAPSRSCFGAPWSASAAVGCGASGEKTKSLVRANDRLHREHYGLRSDARRCSHRVRLAKCEHRMGAIF